MTKVIPGLFAMLKSTKVEIKKEHQVLMVNKTNSFKKKGKGKKGTSRRITSKLLLPRRSPSLHLSLKPSASTTKGSVTRSGTTPSIWGISASSDYSLCSRSTYFRLRSSLPFFLKLVVLLTINTWCSFLISTFVDFNIAKSLGITFVIPYIL